jgi:hypothetical protein
MGRYVYENRTGECVWKYAFAEQSSEQSRISHELGIGHMIYNKRGTHDTLVLYCSQSTVNRLRQAVRHNCGDNGPQEKHDAFWYMVWNLANWVEKQIPAHKGQRLRFWGEY